MISRDKQLHFIAGILISVISFLSILLFSTLSNAVLISTLLYVAAAIGKELYDLFFPAKHTVDAWDALFTIFGGALSTLIMLIIVLLT